MVAKFLALSLVLGSVVLASGSKAHAQYSPGVYAGAAVAACNNMQNGSYYQPQPSLSLPTLSWPQRTPSYPSYPAVAAYAEPAVAVPAAVAAPAAVYSYPAYPTYPDNTYRYRGTYRRR